jgi:hypothetical protein
VHLAKNVNLILVQNYHFVNLSDKLEPDKIGNAIAWKLCPEPSRSDARDKRRDRKSLNPENISAGVRRSHRSAMSAGYFWG